MTGKGDKWRKDVDYNMYWTNFPTLSGEIETRAKKVTKKDGKATYTYGK